jgi:lysophospholipase L1-like esterase
MKKHPLIAGLLLCAGGILASVAAAQDNDRGRDFDRDRSGSALTLGDSVVFGYITQANPQYVNAANFVGYPEFLSDMLDLDVTNASCPGETTSHLLSLTGADYKCGGYRGPFPLHVKYGSSQLDFAKGFLARQRNVRLVTIGIGANDIFALQTRCAINEPNNPGCVPYGLPPVLNQVAQNIAWLITQLRSTGYRGPIVVVNYYSPDYTDPQLMQLTGALNQAIAGAAQPQGAVIADVFTAFLKAASAPAAGGRTCSTGLLNVNPAQPALCDFHPSLSGQKLIAQTIAASLRGRNW